MAYSRQLVINVAESSQEIYVTARGVGEEPELEFSPSELQLGPCLPNSTEAEAEVTVKNPCSFPIEFYCLELDTQYIEEEKVGYVLLTGRSAGTSANCDCELVQPGYQTQFCPSPYRSCL